MPVSDDEPYELVEQAEEDPRSLSVADLCEAFEEAPGETRAIAQALLVVAEDAPEHYRTLRDGLESMLRSDDTDLQTVVALCVGHIGAEHGDEVRDLVPAVVALLDTDDDLVRVRAGETLRAVGSDVPEALAPHVERFADFYHSDYLDLRHAMVNATADVARVDPEAAAPLTAALFDVVTHRPESMDQETINQVERPGAREELFDQQTTQLVRYHNDREMAALALVEVVKERPDAVSGLVDDVAAAVDEEENMRVRAALVDVLAGLAQSDPELVRPHLEVLARRLDDAAEVVRGKAAWTLATVAGSAPDAVAVAVEDRLDAVVDLLDGAEPNTRAAAATLLSYVAEQDPGLVADATDDLLALLEDDSDVVRGSVVWALGYVGGDRVREALREVADDEGEDPEVRRAARAAARTAAE